MPRLNANNLAETELVESVAEGDTEIEVEDAGVFPEPPFRVTLSDNENVEIVEVADVDGNTLKQVQRGLEETNELEHPSGTAVEQRFTAGMYNDIKESGFTATQSLIKLGQDEMIQMSRFEAPANSKVEVLGGSVCDENGDSVTQETEVELFNHTTDETLFVIDDNVFQRGEPLFEESVDGDELEFRLVNATGELKNLSGKMFYNIEEV